MMKPETARQAVIWGVQHGKVKFPYHQQSFQAALLVGAPPKPKPALLELLTSWRVKPAK